MKNNIKPFFFFIFLVYITPIYSLTFNLKMTDDSFVRAKIYESNGSNLLLWFTSEYGNRSEYISIAKKIQNLGLEVWVIDLFAANYLTPSPKSIDQIQAWQINEIISNTQKSSQKKVWLFSSEKASRLAFTGMRQWQIENPKNNNVGGVLLLNPDFSYGIPPVGESPEYLPITYSMNKPIFVIQSDNTINHSYFDSFLKQLGKNGAVVKSKVIKETRERFQFRRFTTDIEEKKKSTELPSLIHYGIKALEQSSKALPAVKKIAPPKALPNTDYPINLNPLMVSKRVKPFGFRGLENNIVDDSSLLGKVYVLTFWANWCSSCRIQLKRQQKFYSTINNPNFEIASVMFHGKVADAKKLSKRYKLDFPILLGDHKTLKSFNIRKYPSSMIIDKKSKVRYAFYGTPSWNRADITDIINNLLSEK